MVVVVVRMVAVSRGVQSGEAAERICSDWKGCLSFSPVVYVRGMCLLKTLRTGWCGERELLLMAIVYTLKRLAERVAAKLYAWSS